ARRGVGDRMEVDPRVVPRRVHVGCGGHDRRVLVTDRRVAARGGLGGGVGDVLVVGLPGLVRGDELVADRLDRARVYTALAERLPVLAGAGRRELRVRRAVGLGRDVRRLAADLGDVVVEAD